MRTSIPVVRSLTPERSVFFIAFAGSRGKPTFALYYDDLPSPMMLKALPKLLYKRRLEGKWARMSLSQLVAEFNWRAAERTSMPPDNTRPPPKPNDHPHLTAQADRAASRY